MKSFALLFLVCLYSLPNEAESLALQRKPQDLEKFGNGTYDDRFFFLQPLSSGSGSSATTCASTSKCCRIRCPLATPLCGTGPATGKICVAAAGAATAPGTSCHVIGTCAACATDTTISCAGKLECTAAAGGDICALP